MATGNWQVGYDKSVTFAGTALKIKASTWDEHVERLLITHSQSGGVQGWIPGILDGEGHVEANVDANGIPPSLSIIPGIKGLLLFRIGSTSPFSIPIGVTKVHYATAVNGVVEYSFDVALDSETGTYTRAT